MFIKDGLKAEKRPRPDSSQTAARHAELGLNRSALNAIYGKEGAPVHVPSFLTENFFFFFLEQC